MKTFTVYCEFARFKTAKPKKLELLFRSYFAEDPAAAEEQYRADFEIGGQLVTKEIKSPFDAGDLENYSNNEGKHCQHIRLQVTSLRNAVDLAALCVARAGKEWHDDKEAEDHPLFQASAGLKFPRAIRDEAILELVKTHLQVITENENATAKREVQTV